MHAIQTFKTCVFNRKLFKVQRTIYYHRDLRQYLTKLRLSSHKLLVESGRWTKPKINYHERLCTLCDENDIEDEYHILMKCNYFVNLREKYISRKYYKRPSMYKFQKLVNTTKRELYRLMLFIKCIFKECNSRTSDRGVIVQRIVPLSLLFLQIL